MCIKYLPSLYLESVAINLSLISKKFQTVPKFIMSNAHGWWTDDRFKFYTSFCMLNKTKYIDIQHNGTYFIIKKKILILKFQNTSVIILLAGEIHVCKKK